MLGKWVLSPIWRLPERGSIHPKRIPSGGTICGSFGRLPQWVSDSLVCTGRSTNGIAALERCGRLSAAQHRQFVMAPQMVSTAGNRGESSPCGSIARGGPGCRLAGPFPPPAGRLGGLPDRRRAAADRAAVTRGVGQPIPICRRAGRGRLGPALAAGRDSGRRLGRPLRPGQGDGRRAPGPGAADPGPDGGDPGRGGRPSRCCARSALRSPRRRRLPTDRPSRCWCGSFRTPAWNGRTPDLSRSRPWRSTWPARWPPGCCSCWRPGRRSRCRPVCFVIAAAVIGTVGPTRRQRGWRPTRADRPADADRR